jgi:ABC-2 type transport system permease protein
VPLLGTFFLWRAMFAARHESIGGYGFRAMIYYFLLTTFVTNLITPTEDEWQIAADIREGQINALLVKPIDYLAYRTSLFLGYRVTYSTLTLPLTALLFACFAHYVTLPQHGMTWLWGGCSLLLAAFLQFFVTYSVAMLAFWLLEISTAVFIVYSFEYFLSGHLFPLDLLPGWFREVSDWLPFTYELFFPVQILQERVTGAALFHGLLIQSAWVVIMWAVGRLLWRSGVRRYQAFGG